MFEWYDDNENEIMDEEDIYLYNDSEVMSMSQWKEDTEIYRNSIIDAINEEWRKSYSQINPHNSVTIEKDIINNNRIYDDSSCFPYDNLDYWNAARCAEEDIKEVTYTYDELFKKEDDFLGVWKIDEVVLTSDMYTGTAKDGDLQENLYNPEDYVGDEVEYLSNSFRLGNYIYDNPEYKINYVSVEEFQNGGKFRLPDLYGLIDEKKIKVGMSDEYDNLSETLLLRFDVTFAYDIQYETYLVNAITC